MEKAWVVTVCNTEEDELDVEGVFETMEDAEERLVSVCQKLAFEYDEWGDEVREKAEILRDEEDREKSLHYFIGVMARECHRTQVQIHETVIFKKRKGNGTTQ
jgi:hypothetical protein